MICLVSTNRHRNRATFEPYLVLKYFYYFIGLICLNKVPINFKYFLLGTYVSFYIRRTKENQK